MSEPATLPGKSDKFQSRIQPFPDSDTAQQNVTSATNAEVSDGEGLVLKKLVDTPTSTSDLPKQVDIQPLRLDKVNASVDSTPKVAKQPTAAPASKNSASDLKSGWVVQAGIFSKPENAVAIAGILKNNGYAPNVSNAKASFGDAKRVWIGPFASKSEPRRYPGG